MLAAFGISPVDSVHLSKDRARLVEILDESGLDHRPEPMGACVEGTGWK